MRSSSSPLRPVRADLTEPTPVASKDVRRSLVEAAIIGLFLVAVLAVLQFSRALLLPVTLAVVIGTMMAPLAARAARIRIPSPLTALLLVAAFLAALSFVILVLSAFVSEWASRTPEIATTLQQKLQAFDRLFAALRELQSGISGPLGIDVGAFKFDMAANFIGPVLSILTPAIGQLFLFFGTLFFFLSSHQAFRRHLIALSESRRDRLRALRIFNDVESNLSSYVGIVTVINLAIGTLTAIEAALIGLPNPLALGVLAFGLNYIPMIGPGLMATVLFLVGLVVFPSLGYALLAPAIFIGQSMIEGQFVTPSIVGRQMTVNPFAIFLSLAFWVWLWGPLGALLAMPILIVLMVVRAHVYPKSGAAFSD